MQKVIFRNIGKIHYKEAWDYQQQLFDEIVGIKKANRDRIEEEQELPNHYFLFCEHFPVYTLGKSGELSNLLLNQAQLIDKDIEFFETNRGGDITFHGPEQIVGYPILDLDYFFTDIHRYLRLLEQMIIDTLAEYDINAGRLQGATGVWLEPDNPFRARKICAIGVRTSRWVTMHGFAFNINTDLDYFSNIIPCGIDDKAVTSLQKELGRYIPFEEVHEKLKNHFGRLFEAECIEEALS